ncbi:MAG: hypothetical protein K0U47_03360 [Epsilonproteobacteria bacterium]|nr:hypothetical protein [Campylobacterota bacterium]
MDNLITIASQIIICLIIAALLGAIIGYLLGKMSKCDKKDSETKNEALSDYTDAHENSTVESRQTQNVSQLAGASTAATMHLEEKDLTAPLGQEIGIRPSQMSITDENNIDDLKEISGIGLKIEEVLHSIGIYKFEQIASWSSDNIAWIENYLSFKGRIKKEDWIAQAKLLAAGSQTEFSKKVRRGDHPEY